MKTRFLFLAVLGVMNLAAGAEIEPQPFLAAAQRLIDSASFLGTPFSGDEIITLKAAIQSNEAAGAAKAQAVLDAHALFHVTITPEQRVKVERGAAKAVLDESGWRQYLVRVENEAGVTAKLAASSPQAKIMYVPGSPPVAPHAQPKDPGEPALAARWLDMQMFEAPPMQPTLSGLSLEYPSTRRFTVAMANRSNCRMATTMSFSVAGLNHCPSREKSRSPAKTRRWHSK
jgi:hypothetical protein